MTAHQAYKYLEYELGALYGKREADQILSIFFEDLFGITNILAPTAETKFDRGLFEAKSKDLISGIPIQYVTGKVNFFGYDFKVNQNVLIPRPETEELVHWILEDHKNARTQIDLLDIGSGSGCIGITLKKKLPNLRVFAIEKSIEALNVTRINAKRIGTQIRVLRLDFLDEAYWPNLGKMDVIVSNPPYISLAEKDKMDQHVIAHEPDEALFVRQENHLIFYEKIAQFAKIYLNPKGKIYAEMNEFDAQKIRSIFSTHGFTNIEIKKDMQGKDRMIRVF